ncbi:MAG: YezD family protein [Methylophilus sp.]|nr:YezD family protein [Methylophilus sp.]
MSLAKSNVLTESDSEVLKAIAHAIALVQQQTGYGSIEITVHDGRVTQIERREKVRFEHKTSLSKK